MLLLRAQPSLLSHVIEGIVFPSAESLKPNESYTYCSTLSYMIFLLQQVDIDPHIKSQLRSIHQGEGAYSSIQSEDIDVKLSSLADSIIDGMIPAGNFF